MAVHSFNSGTGGGLFSRVLPSFLGAGGNVLGGPMGGMLGRAGGNLVTGNWPDAALDIIRGLGDKAKVPEVAPYSPPAPEATARFNPGFGFMDEFWGKDKPWLSM